MSYFWVTETHWPGHVGVALDSNQIHHDWKLLYLLVITQWELRSLTRAPSFCFCLQLILTMKSFGIMWAPYLFIDDLVYACHLQYITFPSMGGI